MLSLKEFKKLTKSEVINTRFIVGGGVATQYSDGDDYKYSDSNVQASGHVLRGGTEEADPRDGNNNIA